jgi:hypothetical protein
MRFFQAKNKVLSSCTRLRNVVGETNAREIRNIGYKRLLAEVAPRGTAIYKELDASGSVIGTFTP